MDVFDPLGNMEVLRITNLAEHYENALSVLDDDIFRGLGSLRELDVRPNTPLRPRPGPSCLDRSYDAQRPVLHPAADPPENVEYASWRIDHKGGHFETCYAVRLM